MPMLSLSLTRSLDDATRLCVARALTDLTAELLHKKPALTALSIRCVAPDHWYVGAEALTPARTGLFLETRVSAGTNTKDEKSRYIAEVWHTLEELLGPLEPHSYIAVLEIDADAWGYEGQTQEVRHVGARLAG